MENNLPKGWEVKKLVDYVPIIKTGVERFDGEKSYYSTGSISDNEMIPEGKFTFSNRPARANRLVLEKDVVQARMRETQKAVLIDKNLKDSLFSTGFIQFRPEDNNYNSKLFYYYLRSDRFLKQRDENATGSTQVALTDAGSENIDLVIPPQEQQKRIADKLDVLLTKVDYAQSRLDEILLILKHFRQSILAAACFGRLTADWREKNSNPDNIDAMIEAIKKRRDSKTKTVAQKDKFRVIFSSSEENDSSELPEGWRYIFLNKLCNSFDYGTSAKSKPSGKMSVLRMGNIQKGKIDWTDLVFTSDKEEIESYSLQPNTVLFNRTNSPELVGKTAIYRGEQPAIFAGYLIRINPLPELDPEYLNLCLNTTYAKEFCHRVKTDGVSQSNINAQKLGTFEIPFCSLAEQQEIVRKVKKLFMAADQIETRYTKAQAQVDKLTQSILAKAFLGELVSQDSNDEPASVLLEGIREVKQEEHKKTRRIGKSNLEGVINVVHKKEIRPLFDVLKEKGGSLTPEELFNNAGYDFDNVDDFYEILRNEMKQKRIKEERIGKMRILLKVGEK